ncbi:saccharopine dehydrogenase family protein [Ideonella margarita]|uniref:Saccharopine dehydrogenase NADP-binding domain-containing protein n=1 Tax=Ideonella margarita TaxID=2984191 RepID=A0ABU9C5M2_9BURK
MSTAPTRPSDRSTDRPFDIILFGATGFTGRLVAEYLLARFGDQGQTLRWAMAGRSLPKLEALRSELGASHTLPLIEADAGDAGAMTQLVAQARVVITTVGPYQRHGEALVMACARAGTDYVDLCGEPAWMAKMIPLLQGPAADSGARIVFSCGFDSVPFDLGVLYLQHAATQLTGAPLAQVHGRVKVMKGGMSGGTLASALATIEAMGKDPALARTMANPFALTHGFTGPPQPAGDDAAYDELAGAWTGPFVMAPINTKNVHRTNALRGHPWGTQFVYDERMLTRDESRARSLARQSKLQTRLLGIGPVRGLMQRFLLPKPGQGPNQHQRETGRYEVLFMGRTADGRKLTTKVTGDRDPGYGSTCKMISESALCLLQDVDQRMTPGGVWTAGAAMGLTLVKRLETHAGLTFSMVD